MEKRLEYKVIQEKPFQDIMNWELVDKWADGIPVFSENDPRNPEWRETPVFNLDLSSEGYGTLLVKNEADVKSNPTRTIKERPAWELTALYRDYARALALKKRKGINGNITSLAIPRFCYVTSGNVGMAVPHVFKKYGLPPMKLLVDCLIPIKRLEKLKKLYVDIYATSLNTREPLTPEDIRKITHNDEGIDITSVGIIRPEEIFYDWHVHEAFNQSPDVVYVPFGSGRLYENYLRWQEKSLREGISGGKDPRLKVPLERVVSISVVGATPETLDSKADKLTCKHNPFRIFDIHDIEAAKSLSFTGNQTRVYPVKEEYIGKAFDILSRYCDTSFSGSSGLALYLQRFDEGFVREADKNIVINTGKGI